MCQWLEHPNEYGRPPDKIELADSKEIFWPPTQDRRRLWVFRYNYAEEDGTHDGFGMTGSITWSMMGDPPLKTPDEVYAMHCVWEMQHNEDPSAPSKRTVQHGRKILRQFNGYI
jgi:hypothetical protein